MKLLINLIFSIFILINLTSFSKSQSYTPSYISSVTDIPIIAANYFPDKVKPTPFSNVTIPKFRDATNLLATISDPILNASFIETLTNQWGTDVKYALGNSSLQVPSILNPMYYIAQLLPSTKYETGANSWIAMKPKYDALVIRGTGIVNSINLIVNALNGTSLTPTQQSQLNQYTQVSNCIKDSYLVINTIANNMDFLKTISNVSKRYATDVEDGMLSESDILNIVKSNNIDMLNLVYDFYTSYLTLGNLNF